MTEEIRWLTCGGPTAEIHRAFVLGKYQNDIALWILPKCQISNGMMVTCDMDVNPGVKAAGCLFENILSSRALSTSVLVATEAMTQLFQALLLSAARFTLVFGAVQDAYQAVQTTRSTSLLRQFGVDFSQVLV